MTHIELGRVDTADAYQPLRTADPEWRLNGGAHFLERQRGYNEEQLEQVAVEARILGIDPSYQPDRFVEAHNALLGEMEADLNAALPTVKQKVIERTAAYFDGSDIETRVGLEALLSRRLEATTRVTVEDNLTKSLAYAASFSGFSRQLQVTSYELIDCLDRCKDVEEYRTAVHDTTLAHELMHGMVTSALHLHEGGKDLPVRNGLSLHSYNLDRFPPTISKYGDWASEAAIESFRQTIMETSSAGHEDSMMVLHTLEAFLPGLRDRLVIAALDRQDPRLAFAEIESLLGPNAVSNIGEILSTICAFEDLDDLKNRIADMFPRDLRAQGRAVLAQQEVEFLGRRPDYQEWLLEQQTS